ncbi:MAG: TIGR01459 family HAD-type hydrolase [Magnetospiraceae bacterium]
MTAFPPAPRRVQGVREFVDHFDIFLLDAWGVIHDGARLYPGAGDCLARLRQSGKRLIILSNSARREAEAYVTLREVGLPDGLIERVFNSGSLCRDRVATGQFGSTCLAISNDGPFPWLLDDSPIQRTENPDLAAFLLVTSLPGAAPTVKDFDNILDPALARDLPLVCANADKVAIMNGQRRPCPGALADRYAARGGTVHRFGKPYADIYDACFDDLGPVQKDRVLVIGDSFDTDIPGAANSGLQNVFITSGIHQDILGDNPTADQVAAFCAARSQWPSFSLARLVW